MTCHGRERLGDAVDPLDLFDRLAGQRQQREMDRDGDLGGDADFVELEEQVVDLADAAALRAFDRDDARVDAAVLDGLEDGPPCRQCHGLGRGEGRQDALLAEGARLSLKRDSRYAVRRSDHLRLPGPTRPAPAERREPSRWAEPPS
jgi:hypothetical protein